MTLQNRTPMKRCGHSWPDEQAAKSSKRYLNGSFEVETGCPCERVHLRPVKGAPKKERKPAADTGPDRATRALVLIRDGYQCARCGRACGPGIGPYSLQHRKPRGSGGTSDPEANSPVRLLLLCGTATTGCHGEVESRSDPHDQAKGYRLESWQDPLAEPVMYFEPGASGFTAWLLPDGSLGFEPPGGANARGETSRPNSSEPPSGGPGRDRRAGSERGAA